jgi:hypothetical protein
VAACLHYSWRICNHTFAESALLFCAAQCATTVATTSTACARWTAPLWTSARFGAPWVGLQQPAASCAGMAQQCMSVAQHCGCSGALGLLQAELGCALRGRRGLLDRLWPRCCTLVAFWLQLDWDSSRHTYFP